MTSQLDHRQRFFIDNSPIRGDVVRLSRNYASIIAQKDYPESIKCLLGEMLAATGLLVGTLKIEGRLSIQLQSSDEDSLLNWVMAECDHDGSIRGLASWKEDTAEHQQIWQEKITANEAFSELGALDKGLLFINIQPIKGKPYQGIVERSHDNLADCLAHYQRQSAQIPTVIKLACDGLQVGGILIQMLPLSQQEKLDAELDEHAGADDLWRRLQLFTNTVKGAELTKLDTNEILFRLYNEEEVVIPEPVLLEFSCTCSKEKYQSAIMQLGKEQAMSIVEEQGTIEIDCGFCGGIYQFNNAEVEYLFI